MKNLHFFSAIVLLICFSTSCGKKKENKNSESESEQKLSTQKDWAYKRNFEDLDVSFRSYVLDNSKHDTVFLENGGFIACQPGSFLDSKGKPLKSKAKIEFKFLQSHAEILMSGYPMHFKDGSDEVKRFLTDGMFEINGKDPDGEPITLDPAKPLTVAVPSVIPNQDSVGFFKVNNEGEWDYLEPAPEPVENKRKKGLLNSIDNAISSLKKNNLSENEPLKFDLSLDFDENPELKPFEDVVWVYQEGFGNPSQAEMKKMLQSRWEKIEVLVKDKKNGLFTITFKKGNSQKSVVAKILGQGEKNEKMSSLSKADQQTLDSLSKAKTNALRVADKLRMTTIRGFGVYNCDYVFSVFNTLKPIKKIIVLYDEKQEQCPTKAIVQSFPDLKRLVFHQNLGNFPLEESFKMNEKLKNNLLVVTSKNRVVLLKNDKIKNNPSFSEETITFFLKPEDFIEIKNQSQLEELIAKL